MSFLTTTKIIGKRLKPTDYNQYIAELVLLALIAIAYFGYDDLSPLRNATPTATVERNDFALIGGLGLYAIRLASFVAMFRHYRMPQTPEWLVFITVTTAMIICFALSGTLVQSYAEAHNYRFCYSQHDRATTYTFAHSATACPALPANSDPT